MYVLTFYFFITEHSNGSIQLPTTSNSEPSTSYERLQMDTEIAAAAYQTLGTLWQFPPYSFVFKNDYTGSVCHLVFL